MKRFTADFETATWVDDETWVWAWALCDIEEPTHVEVGNSIESFFERIKAPIRDLSLKFGYSESKVKSLLFRTRTRLKHALQEEGLL